MGLWFWFQSCLPYPPTRSCNSLAIKCPIYSIPSNNLSFAIYSLGLELYHQLLSLQFADYRSWDLSVSQLHMTHNESHDWGFFLFTPINSYTGEYLLGSASSAWTHTTCNLNPRLKDPKCCMVKGWGVAQDWSEHL